MLKVDTDTPPSKPWSKVQALTSFIQLKSGPSTSPSNKNDNHTPLVSHSNTGSHEQETQEQQPKADRLKIFIGSWNMYGRLLDIDLEPFLTTRHPSTTSPTEPANPTLQPDSNKKLVEHDKQNGKSPFLDSSTDQPYHLLAIGTQECERDISEALFYPSKEVWEKRLGDYLGDRYQMVRCETLAALHLAVFVLKSHTSYVKNVHSADIKTGWANMVGNKGAVAVSLDFGSQSLLFINCHLRAHQTKLEERNANVHRILHELQIKGGNPAHGPSSSNALFHLPSLKMLTQPARSIKSAKSAKSTRSTGSAKSSDKAEPSPKDKTSNNLESPATPKDNNSPLSITSATQNDTKAPKASADGAIANINPPKNDETATEINTVDPVQQQSTDKSPIGTNNDNNEPSTIDSKKSSGTTSKPQSKKNNSDSKRKSSTSLTSASLTSVPPEEQHSVTEQFDHVFIFGDTNYRINADRQFVLDNIKKQDFKTLLKYDQLTLERQQNTTPLAAFSEHPIDFIPTYKFDAIDAESTDSSSSVTSSSSSLPMSPATTTCNAGQQEDQISPASSSSPQPPLPTTAAETPTAAPASASSSSESFVITPKNSLHNVGSVSLRYDTSPKQRVPSWTDRILWHDRHHIHHSHNHNDQQPNATHTSPSAPISRSGPSATVTTTNQSQQTKPKRNQKWINALKRKNKNDLLDRGLPEAPPVDKNTVCYHYDTVMDPRLMGVSDHLPVVGVFGVWFDEWENGASKGAKSIKSFKKKVPLWKKWLL
ncbi:hypothetical protein BCR42DRAFT_418122 [Absidia repens]|uniref:Inositol polyphosphate-related phosphatase domain-containing protein n=1 Tax=Absidia repens TaxID=90262 RepID=A0A1X2ID37_9FUNG|nr:hypothetical protein BCR42DRAFT_418122 [Absidia repens]